MLRSRRSAVDDQDGAAVVDFVLVVVVLVPLVLAIIQVALLTYVRTALAGAASEGAAYGATAGRGPDDAVARTRSRLAGVIGASRLGAIGATTVQRDGVAFIEVRVEATVSALGPWAPGIRTRVTGHAVVEVP